MTSPGTVPVQRHVEFGRAGIQQRTFGRVVGRGTLSPKPPGIYRFDVKSMSAAWGEQPGVDEPPPDLLPTPGWALGSVPTVALSSLQVRKM